MTKRLLQKNKKYQRLATVLCSLLVIAGCSKEQPSAPSPVPAQQAKPGAVVPVKPVQKQASSSLRLPPPVAVNQFDFSKKKDPFKPYIEIKADSKKSTDVIKLRKDALPIHSFDVGQFKLIGIITGGRENKAMVTDPGGKGYVLKAGMTIGKNEGKVVNINSNGVDILEQFKDDSGRVRKENIKLTLPRKQ